MQKHKSQIPLGRVDKIEVMLTRVVLVFGVTVTIGGTFYALYRIVTGQ